MPLPSGTPLFHRTAWLAGIFLGLTATSRAAPPNVLIPGQPAPETTRGTNPLKVGAQAPDYALPDQDGKMHTLKADRGHVILLEFYPGDFTFSCTIEADALAAAAPDLQKLGVITYGISVQGKDSHLKFIRQEGLNYTLLSDTERVVSRKYGVLMPVGGGLARRVTYIVGRDGRIVHADTDVQSHLHTAGKDWLAWLNAHPEIVNDPETHAAQR